jgi:hypothetical protein
MTRALDQLASNLGWGIAVPRFFGDGLRSAVINGTNFKSVETVQVRYPAAKSPHSAPTKGELPAEPPASTLHGDVEGRAVPRFFFQVLREGWELDPVPEVLPEPATALAKARAIARELLADAEGEWLSARIEVADEHGNVVGIVQVSDFRIQ